MSNCSITIRTCSVNSIKNVVINSRISNINLSKLSHLFLIMLHNQEIGYLILDMDIINMRLCIYELFICHNFRGNKIGRYIINYIIRNYQKKGFLSISVLPRPIENDPILNYKEAQLKLKSWYLSLGFKCKFDNNEELEILLK